ncbi:hypothetical protein [Streptomyces sp. NBC_00059]|uniref:SDR family oxidoreductase n=1 Tax=Streptomyces sp. NBC_00059 TaxID=2975635 RepID=UPI00338F1BBA
MALAGRDRSRLDHAAQVHPGAPTACFDAYAPESCVRAVRETSAALGGLDAVVVAFGSVAFGAAQEIGDDVAEHLMAVNYLAPAAFFRAALGILRPGAAIAAVTGVVVDRPEPRTHHDDLFGGPRHPVHATCSTGRAVTPVARWTSAENSWRTAE